MTTAPEIAYKLTYCSMGDNSSSQLLASSHSMIFMHVFLACCHFVVLLQQLGLRSDGGWSCKSRKSHAEQDQGHCQQCRFSIRADILLDAGGIPAFESDYSCKRAQRHPSELRLQHSLARMPCKACRRHSIPSSSCRKATVIIQVSLS